MAEQSKASPVQGREIIVVLGVERSGTSLLTNILHSMGMGISPSLLPASAINPRGFFEDLDCLAVNDDLAFWFMRAVHHAAAVLPLPDGWLKHPRTLSLKGRLEEILVRNILATPGMWGFKHPKTIRFFPLWREAMDSLGVKPRSILAVRHPMRVATALADFAVVPAEHGLSYWLTVNLEAIVHTGGHLHVVHYEDWFDQPEGKAENLAHYVGLSPNVDREDLRADLADIIRPELFHNTNAPEISNTLAAKLYADLCRFSAGACRAKELLSRAEEYQRQWVALLPSAWSLEIEVKRSRFFLEQQWDKLKNIHNLDSQSEDVKQALVTLEAQVERLRRNR